MLFLVNNALLEAPVSFRISILVSMHEYFLSPASQTHSDRTTSETLRELTTWYISTNIKEELSTGHGFLG